MKPDSDEKRRLGHAAAAVKNITRDLREAAEDLLSGRKPRTGFASDLVCVIEDAGALMLAVLTLETQAEEIDRLREECARRAETEERSRKEINKLLTAQLRAPAMPAKNKRPALPPAPTPAPASSVAPCKHKEWDTTKTPPVCKACGKVKSARGRKNADPAANVATATVDGTTKVDPPSLPLPLAKAAEKGKGLSVELAGGGVVQLDEVDDEFAEGTLGGRAR